MPVYRPPILRPHTHAGLHDYRQRQLYQELQLYNLSEDIVTYDVPTAGWVPWTRPVRVFSSGALTAVAASGFQNLSDADEYTPPICPHASDISRDAKYSVMELNLRKKYQGRTVDYFQVPRSSHNCPFVVVIPPLHPPLILFTQQEIDEHTSFQDEEEAAETREMYTYDKDFLQGFSDSSPSKASTSSAAEVELIALPHASSSRTPSLSRSSSAADLRQRPLFSLAPSCNTPGSECFNPRVLPSLTFGNRPTPSPQPILSPRGSRAHSFFSDSVATARRNSASLDMVLMNELYYNDKMGLFKETPSLHPVWDLNHTPRVLQPYDEGMYPGCSNRINQNLDFFVTEVGQTIRELNSTLGIPRATLQALVELAIKCDCCGCMYSPDGFSHHLVNDHCGNSMFHRQVLPKIPDVEALRELKLRSFADPPQTHLKEFLDTPIGIAFLEFNSKIGIPLDVWVTISTAYKMCSTCHLCRSFPAHQAHLDSDGKCHDFGEGVASLVSGKGKARDTGGFVELNADSGTVGAEDKVGDDSVTV
ncbi:hypothetical protein BDZ97DRAFT_1762515 [Flammula alnicola]|nr:hypothetical protein BDZ97DRAFT_1762515 [Flammula alnicola]